MELGVLASNAEHRPIWHLMEGQDVLDPSGVAWHWTHFDFDYCRSWRSWSWCWIRDHPHGNHLCHRDFDDRRESDLDLDLGRQRLEELPLGQTTLMW